MRPRPPDHVVPSSRVTVFTVACVALVTAAVVSLRIDERPRVVPRLSPVAGGR